MSVEVNVVGVQCGLACSYCYQLPVRTATKNRAPVLNHEAIQAAVLAANPGPAGFSVFGGEALLAKVDDLERIWAFGLKHYGTNGVQTSGVPITDEHLVLFKRYRVHVGFSIDGPGELNDARAAGSPTATGKATAHSIAMLERCLAEGIGCSLIVTLHRLNASPDRLPRLLDWFRGLDAAGLSSARLHLLERDGPGGERLALTDVENTAALISAQKLEGELKRLKFDVFADIAKKLRDPEASATCVWNGCDPWTTPAVHGIEADGSRGLCQRVHKDGQKWSPADSGSNIRQQVLWSTPQEEGGCRGCRFFLQCGGHCYSDDTEVLTRRGWIHFRDVRLMDELATLRDDGTMVYDRPSRLVVKPYSGEMLAFRSKGIDLLVTPDHPMLVWSQSGQRVEKAGEQAVGYRSRFTAEWKGTEQRQHHLAKPKNVKGKDYCTTSVPAVPMDAWLEFLGWFISEGSSSSGALKRPTRAVRSDRSDRARRFITAVSQKNEGVVRRVACILKQMGFTSSVLKRRSGLWVVKNGSRQMHEELSPLGKATEKHVPGYVKQLTSAQILVFLTSLFAGDGASRGTGRTRRGTVRWESYSTTSKRLADDVQELLLKVGLSGTITSRDPRADPTKRVRTFGSLREWVVTVRHGQSRGAGKIPYATIPKPHRVPYDGLVYDVTMPASPTILVRRNGRATWGHNCPGTAIDGDWRKRTVDCQTWFALLERTEQEMVSRGESPASLAPDLEARIERSLTLAKKPGGHGDAHGDSPHGDQHGDHSDGSAK